MLLNKLITRTVFFFLQSLNIIVFNYKLTEYYLPHISTPIIYTIHQNHKLNTICGWSNIFCCYGFKFTKKYKIF